MEFVVLPDREFVSEKLQLTTERVVVHASGRPWIVGQWDSGEITVLTAGNTRLAIAGRTEIREPEVSRALAAITSPSGLDKLARRIPGAVHLLLSQDGATRSQGTVSTVRQIFYATVDGFTVASSSIAQLGRLAGATIDPEALALRLLSPLGAPWPLSQRTFWTGIQAVPVGHWLAVDRGGSARTHRWWHPPEPVRSLEAAAAEVRESLFRAVASRVPGGRMVTADLSGGLDSTSVAFLAAAAGADLTTFHVQPLDPANTDTVWAERAAAALPGARHRVVPRSRPANLFQVDVEQGTGAGQWEGPQLWIGGWAHLADLERRATAEGSDLHLMGFGGDTLFGAMPAHLWSLARRHPLRALPTIRRSRLLNRWSWSDCLRGLTDRSTFAQAIAALPAQIDAPPPRPPHLDLGWVPAARIPPWATGAAAETVRNALRTAAASDPQPLDPDRVRHQVLEAMAFEGALLRQIRAATGPGVEWDAPMLDHQVVEAALSVRLAERSAPGQYKPLLTAAMRGLVPDAILNRPDKGEFSAEMHEGLRRNRQTLLELCDGSQLGELGLIDVAALRARLLNPGPVAHHLTILQNTLACESWLRSSVVASAWSGRKTGVLR
ncbi:asparagine synthase-related protein [Micromonospora trifolii]|uniref:asparagine synthase-related protein n=1 Tax=Micromonospora trifolii TaxID=2911208 RepID=UPI003D2EFD48